MRAPVRRRDLVFNQVVDRFGIGHPQQGLGQTHETDAFVGREAVFVEERLHHRRLGVVADPLDKPRSPIHDGLPPVWLEPQPCD